MPLGLLPGMDYEEKETVLNPGDYILLHSDGLVEAHDPAAPDVRLSAAAGPAGRAYADPATRSRNFSWRSWPVSPVPTGNRRMT